LFYASVVLLGVIGLSASTGYLDYVLIPAVAGFIGLTLYALWRQKRESTHNKEV
jgi:mercuric ion transport protein